MFKLYKNVLNIMTKFKFTEQCETKFIPSVFA